MTMIRRLLPFMLTLGFEDGGWMANSIYYPVQMTKRMYVKLQI